MSAGTVSLCYTLLFFSFFVFVSADPTIITAESGQDVTLTCRTPNKEIKSVHWSRDDLTNEYVVFYQKGQFVPDSQHRSFKNRVYLQDRQMKDGDVSLILKDVTTADSGTYVCRVFIEETRSWKNSIIINLIVRPDQKNITAVSGQNVTLTCRAPNNNIIVLEWRRAEHGANYVFLYREGHFDPANQDPSFKGRVDLQDRQMKDGDVSLILRNVNTADTGTYKCGVFMRETRLWQNSIIYLTVVDPPEPKNITAEFGQDVTLTCRAVHNNIVKWSTADLVPQYVLLYQDGRFVTDNQHPSFRNRVDLQDRQMKAGDVSLILKNVTINDTGIYECRVQREGDSMNLISIIHLHVVPPGQPGGHPAWIVALLVFLVIILVLLGACCIYIKKTTKKQRSYYHSSCCLNKSLLSLKKTDDQRQKETDDVELHLQSPQLNCESDHLRTDINKSS